MPAFASGVLAAEAMERLRQNQDYLFSMEAYAAPMFRAVECWAESATDRVCAVWQMRHWSKWLTGYVECIGVAGGAASFKIQIHDGTGWFDAYNVAGVTATTFYTVTAVDLTGGTWSALVKGSVYQVRLVATNCHLRVHRLYHYGALPASKGGYDWYTHNASFLTDALAAASVGAELNGWITNLNYLRDQLGGPWAPISQRTYPHHGVGGYPARYSFRHRGGYFAYQGGGKHHDTNSGTGSWGPAIESPAATFNTIGTLGATYYDSEFVVPGYGVAGYTDRLSENRYIGSGTSSLGALTPGTWYTLAFGRRIGSGTVDGFVAAVAQTGGEPSTSGWTTVPAFAEGELVSLLAGTPFRKFHDNLATLKTRIDDYPHMLYEYQTQAENDAGAIPADTSVVTQKEQHFIRRGDVVAWRGTNVKLRYSTKRVPLEASPRHREVELGTSASAGAAESLLDLNSLEELPYEGDYMLDALGTGRDLVWAFELLG
jgi:hypothetical protein